MVIEQKQVTIAIRRTEPKRFYCGTNDLCMHKHEWVPNKRCFADYVIRCTCRYVIRKDGKSWAQGSTEQEELEK
jgi:hypothetical protein